MVHRLRNGPTAYQTSVATKWNLPKTSTWPCKEWSHGGALSLKTLGEYVAALRVDFLHYSKEKDSYPVPQVDSMIRKRWEMQNAIAYMVERAECRDQLCLGAAVC